jgi:hypothetical protein
MSWWCSVFAPTRHAHLPVIAEMLGASEGRSLQHQGQQMTASRQYILQARKKQLHDDLTVLGASCGRFLDLRMPTELAHNSKVSQFYTQDSFEGMQRAALRHVLLLKQKHRVKRASASHTVCALPAAERASETVKAGSNYQ